MKLALFTNFTTQEFVGYWDGKPKRFAPGQTVYMPDFLARHFAKHLTNKELLRTDSNGNLVHKDGDKMTSPKKPEEFPLFMELFNKAYQPEAEDELNQPKKDDIDVIIDAANKNRGKTAPETEPATLGEVAKAEPEQQDPTKPQIIVPPDFDEDDEDTFNGKPQE